MDWSGAQSLDILSLIERHSQKALYKILLNSLLFSLVSFVVDDIFDNYLIAKILQKSRVNCYIIFSYRCYWLRLVGTRAYIFGLSFRLLPLSTSVPDWRLLCFFRCNSWKQNDPTQAECSAWTIKEVILKDWVFHLGAAKPVIKERN